MSTMNLNVSDVSSKDPPASETRRGSRPLTVRVSEYGLGHINPSPIKIPRDRDLLEEFLSPRKLQALTGVDDLETVEYLEMRVNTEQMSLGNFGMHLPNLSQIKLSGSYIPSVRDLGTSLWSLQVLWMPQCSLQCLDGLVTMSNLKELYLAYNEVDDISSCGMLEHLEILDLEGNLLADVSCVNYLSMCQSLVRLTLEGNPLCAPCRHTGPRTYRGAVCAILPALLFLDDLPTSGASQAGGDAVKAGLNPDGLEDTASATLQFEEHWNFINSVLVEAGLLADSGRRSPEDSGRPASSLGPPSSSRPLSSRARLSPGTARPLSSRRPQSAETVDSGQGPDEQREESGLTAGVVVCGSVTKSLRRRGPGQSLRTETSVPLTARGHPCEDSVEESCDLVLRELDEWRKDYERSKTRIERQRAPQVLTIDCSEEEIEAVDLGGPRKGRQLNPVRVNGKVGLPSSWGASGASEGAPGSAPAAPQASRMRRQLLQAGVAVLTPSRPRLKK